MLAYKVDAKPIDWSENVFMQPKLDGVRCIIQTDDQGKVIAYSRTGKPWLNINHILKDLKPFFDQQPDVILDGELYNHDLRDDFEQIISLVRTQKPSPYVRSKSKKLVQFHCYDYANGSDSYKTRMDNLAGYVKGKGKRTGTLGKFIMKDDEGIEFGCPPGKGFNYKDLTKILNNIDDYIGQRATFTYFERTKANSYRHPMFKTLRNYE